MFSGGCSTPEACERSLQALSDGLNELWTTMSNDGVRDVVYIRYAKGAGTTNPDNLPTMPPAPPQICVTGPIRCTSIDTTDMVMGQLLDGIHPTSAANDRIAEGVLAVLEMKGIRR
jgi:lysophospholipase L1-like esterase